MNRIILVGRMTRDPELKATETGISVCSFTVACDRKFVKQGEERKADFINCKAWRQSGEAIAKYFKKGDRIALDGSLQVRQYTDSEGKNRYISEVVVDQWEFAQSKAENTAQGNFAPQMNEPALADDYGDFTVVEEDDLPF